MKEGWEVKKLGDVCDFQGGSQPPKNEWSLECKEGYVRMLQIRDFTQSRNFDIEYVKISNRLKYCDDSDILLGRYGASVGKILTGLSGAYNVAIIKSIPDEKKVIKSFIKYFFSSQMFQQHLQIVCTQRAAQAGFSKDDICDYPINVPTLSEQSRIVEELDQLSNIIEKKRQQLSELDNLAQSIFYDMFGDPVTNEKGWEVKKLGEVSNIVGGSTPKTNVEEYWKGEHFWVTPAELKGARYIERTERCISEEAITKTNLTLLLVGTVLLSSRAPIGKVCITKTQMYCNQGFKNVICFDSLNNEYVCQFLMIQKDFLQSLGTGATFKEISKKVTENIDIPLPPLTLQQLFAQKIEAIEKEKELIKQSIKETEELFNSRMDYYFG